MVETARAVTHGALKSVPQRLRSSRVHGDVRQAQLGHGAGQPAGAPRQRLDEVQVQVGTGDGEGQAGQARAAAHVDDLLTAPCPGWPGARWRS